jgi:hypothetical protein
MGVFPLADTMNFYLNHSPYGAGIVCAPDERTDEVWWQAGHWDASRSAARRRTAPCRLRSTTPLPSHASRGVATDPAAALVRTSNRKPAVPVVAAVAIEWQ